MTEPRETRSKIDIGLVLGVAAFCVTIINTTVSFGEASDARFDHVAANFKEVAAGFKDDDRRLDAAERRLCVLEGAAKRGECAR